jgi:rod shape-determining protein MreB
MGLFSFLQQKLQWISALPTQLFFHNDKIVVDEPSIVALDERTGKLVAIGHKARQMHGKTHEGIRTVRPLRDGVIADFNSAELMIRGMIKMLNKRRSWFNPSLKMVVCIPSGSTEVELRAVRDSSEHAGGREVYMIYEPMAAAIGIGMDVEAPQGNMVVDIGGGTTEVAVISLGGIVCNRSIRIAGDDFTEDIQEYMRRQHNIKIGDRTAEDIKINVGAAIPELDNPPPDYIVRGPHQMTALQSKFRFLIRKLLIVWINQSRKSKLQLWLFSSLLLQNFILISYTRGIFLAGGGALLRGLDKRLSDKTNIPVHIADDPLHAVARGTGIALKNVDKFPFLIR